MNLFESFISLMRITNSTIIYQMISDVMPYQVQESVTSLMTVEEVEEGLEVCDQRFCA